MTNPNSTEKLYLEAHRRSILGKGVKRLRKGGTIPANVFGKGFPSLPIAIDERDFRKIYSQAGQTGVVYLKVDGKEIPTLIGETQSNPVKGWLLHVDFRKINLKQKIETVVPLEFIGASPAEKEGAVILYQKDKITIEALPTNIPSAITINLESLTEIGQSVTVGDIPVAADYVIKDDPEQVIVSVTEHKEESTDPDTASTIPETEDGTSEVEEAPESIDAGQPESKE
ncbi:MAG: 50S ribosomal protein L25 [Patescibacteria group bacterium]|nr:50S ribosomal protein L25 [Patescibacteria group bacterium]